MDAVYSANLSQVTQPVAKPRAEKPLMTFCNAENYDLRNNSLSYVSTCNNTGWYKSEFIEHWGFSLE